MTEITQNYPDKEKKRRRPTRLVAVKNGVRIHIEDVTDDNHNRTDIYTCICCTTRLIPRRGDIYAKHFAHKSLIDCDTWTESDSKWKQKWQSLFNSSCVEQIYEKQNSKHIVDIQIGRHQIILQTRSMTAKLVKEKEQFFDNLVWVFNSVDVNFIVFQHQENYDESMFLVSTFRRTITEFVHKLAFIDTEAGLYQIIGSTDRYELLIKKVSNPIQNGDDFCRILRTNQINLTEEIENQYQINSCTICDTPIPYEITWSTARFIQHMKPKSVDGMCLACVPVCANCQINKSTGNGTCNDCSRCICNRLYTKLRDGIQFVQCERCTRKCTPCGKELLSDVDYQCEKCKLLCKHCYLKTADSYLLCCDCDWCGCSKPYFNIRNGKKYKSCAECTKKCRKCKTELQSNNNQYCNKCVNKCSGCKTNLQENIDIFCRKCALPCSHCAIMPAIRAGGLCYECGLCRCNDTFEIIRNEKRFSKCSKCTHKCSLCKKELTSLTEICDCLQQCNN